MSRAFVAVGAALVLAAFVALAGCGTQEGSPTGGGSSPASTGDRSRSPGANATQRAVHADARRMKADIEGVLALTGDARAADPYRHAPDSHAFNRLMPRGPAALDAIATETEATPNDDLYVYVLAIAGKQIQNVARDDSDASTPPKSWDSGREWAAQYRSGKQTPLSPN